MSQKEKENLEEKEERKSGVTSNENKNVEQFG